MAITIIEHYNDTVIKYSMNPVSTKYIKEGELIMHKGQIEHIYFYETLHDGNGVETVRKVFLTMEHLKKINEEVERITALEETKPYEKQFFY